MRCAAAVWALGVLALGGGCGGGSAAPVTPDPTPPSGVSRPGDGPDELVITVRDGSGTSTQWRLSCDPPGGTHPDPALACRVLEQNGASALPAVRKDRMCSQVYGGPETATITGSWHGRPVFSTLSRVNGCETGRWNALVGLLPRPGG